MRRGAAATSECAWTPFLQWRPRALCTNLWAFRSFRPIARTRFPARATWNSRCNVYGSGRAVPRGPTVGNTPADIQYHAQYQPLSPVQDANQPTNPILASLPGCPRRGSYDLSLIHISAPTRLLSISYA